MLDHDGPPGGHAAGMNAEPGAPLWSSLSSPPRTARDRILAAATDLFCRNGFAATGIDSVVARSGASKSTLYAHFKSKSDLIEAVLDREGAAWRAWFFGRISARRGTPHEKLEAVFDTLEEWFSDPAFYGCPFINAIAETAPGDDRMRSAARRHKAHLLTWLRGQAVELGRPDPDRLAREMVVLIDGAIVAAQGAHDASFARSARRLVAFL